MLKFQANKALVVATINKPGFLVMAKADSSFESNENITCVNNSVTHSANSGDSSDLEISGGSILDNSFIDFRWVEKFSYSGMY